MNGLLQELRLAVRMLVRRPGLVAAATVTLAIGIGASTAIFGLVDAVVFKGVPGLRPPPGLVEVSRDLGGQYADLSYPVFRELRESSAATSDLAALAITPLSLAGDPEPTVHTGMAVTGNYFSLLRLQPAVGRFFAPEHWFHPDVAAEAVISHHLWSERFGSDPEIVGRTLRINGYPVTVIGVGPPGFRGHQAPLAVDLFVPLGMPAPGLETAAGLASVDARNIEVLGELAPRRTAAEAEQELGLLADRFVRRIAPGMRDERYRMRVLPWQPVPGVARTAVTMFLGLLAVVVGLALALTCANVASLVLARVAERRGELAVRQALGASRFRMTRQLLIEAQVLFLAGGIAGLLLASWLLRLLLLLEPPLPPGFTVALDLTFDWRVFLFGFLTTVAAATLFGLVPALSQALRGGLAGTFAEIRAESGTVTRLRGRHALVGLQVGITVVLLIVAGLFARSLRTMRALDPGWDAKGVYVMPLDLELAGYTVERGEAFFEALLARVRASPWAESATLASKMPLAGRSLLRDVNVDGIEPPAGSRGFTVLFNRVASDYFRTMRLALLRGRDLGVQDRPDGPRVAVVNQAMAQRFWPGGAAVGRRFTVGVGDATTAYEVIGVVENAKYSSLVEETPNFVYVPWRQRYNHQMVLHVRGRSDAELAARGMRETVRALDPGLPVQSIMPLEEALQSFFLPQRLASWVAGILGSVGLLLAAIGTYGVAAFVAVRRRREIGVRLALGARRTDIVWLLVRDGLTAPVRGAVIGLAVAAVLTRLLHDLIAGISPVDALTFAAVLIGVTVVTCLAVLLSAGRAARAEPAATLRE